MEKQYAPFRWHKWPWIKIAHHSFLAQFFMTFDKEKGMTNLLNMSVVVLVEAELMHFGQMCGQSFSLTEDHSVTD